MGAERDLLRRLLAPVPDVVEVLVPVVVSGLIGLIAGIVLLRWRKRQVWRRACAASRWVEVASPPGTETAHGQELWRQLTGLLRPGALGAWRRLLVWELHAQAERISAGVWVPGTIDAEHVAQALRASYRRCAVTVRAPDGADDSSSPPPAASAGYVVVPRTSTWQPLLAEATAGSGTVSPRMTSRGSSTDSLDGLWTALAETPRGYRTVVQILVRPLPRRTRAQARQVRRAAGERGRSRVHRGALELLLTGIVTLATGLLAGLLEVFAPGPRRAATSRSPGRSPTPALDPITQLERRTAAVKASAELAEVCVRIVTVGPDRSRCRELAWRAANSLRGAVTAQGTDTLRLPDAGRRLHTRQTGNGPGIRVRGRRPGHWRGWFVATDTEVGALARLPHRPAWFRFVTAGAPHLAAPEGLPRLLLRPFEAHTPDAGNGAGGVAA
jgi:hypothetical protein